MIDRVRKWACAACCALVFAGCFFVSPFKPREGAETADPHDGSEIPDLDSDGFAAEESGGTDCDDGDASINPEAEEIPCDGIDQDCNGFDLVDSDGDGHACEAAGGDDCADWDDAVHPGVEEVPNDGLDNDCNGHVDEVRACPDGSGEFLTIQAAVDAASDGSTVEICPGRWTEHVVVFNRVIMLAGVGDLPDSTVLDATNGGPAVLVTGDDAYVTLDWLSLQGDELGDQLVGFSDDPTVVLRRLDISTGTIESIDSTGWCEFGGALTITHSRIRGGVRLSGWCVRTMSIVGNTIDSEANVALGWASDVADFRNNVVTGVSLFIWMQYSTTDSLESALPVRIANNTFVDTTVGFDANVGYDDDVTTPVEIENNIFQGGDLGGKWGQAYYAAISADTCGDVDPRDTVPSFQANLHWANLIPDPPGSMRCCDNHATWEDTKALESAFRNGYAEVDPIFAYTPEMGSYSLSPESPGVDAGVGDNDPDHSPPDIGAFGGPDGDWYLEYPWPLD